MLPKLSLFGAIKKRRCGAAEAPRAAPRAMPTRWGCGQSASPLCEAIRHSSLVRKLGVEEAFTS